MVDEDARDLGITAAIDQLVKRIMAANNFSRQEAVDRLNAFVETERDDSIALVKEEARA